MKYTGRAGRRTDGAGATSAPRGRSHADAAALAELAPQWRRLQRTALLPLLEHDPDWLAIEAAAVPQEARAARVVTVERTGRVCALAPFLLYTWRWPLRLGRRTVATVPVRVARLGGAALLGEESVEAHAAVLAEVARAPDGIDLLFFESLPATSPLRRLLAATPAWRRDFWLYRPDRPRHHWRIDLPESLDAYFAQKRGATARKLRQIDRRLERLAEGRLAIERVTDPGALLPYLQAVEALSARLWQGRERGERVTVVEQCERLAQYARRGWLRAYLMRCGITPVAFGIGHLYQGVFAYHQCGYDPDWSQAHPGKVLLLRIVADLIESRVARWFDFGPGDYEFKRLLATHATPAASVYLVRKSPAMVAPWALCQALGLINRVGGGLRRRLGRGDRGDEGPLRTAR